jgi:hypothetical protein
MAIRCKDCRTGSEVEAAGIGRRCSTTGLTKAPEDECDLGWEAAQEMFARGLARMRQLSPVEAHEALVQTLRDEGAAE